MGRHADSFKRLAPKFKAHPKVLVICEDKKSAKDYFEEAARNFRALADVEFDHCGRTDPKGIVENAIRRSSKYDQILCVIDRDTHDSGNFNEALRLGQESSKITVLVSYPCFEFWLLLHFGFSRSPFSGSGARSPGDMVVEVLRSKEGMSGYAKGSIIGLFARLLPRLPDAMANAERSVLAAHDEDEMNPSTQLHELITLLKKLGKPIEL